MEFNGLISEGSDYNELFIGDEVLSYEAEYFNDKLVKLVYYLSNAPIDPSKAVEAMLTQFYQGFTEADGAYIYGSSWTGCYARHDRLEIGGHDIIEELSQHIGEYCLLKIELFECE